MDTQLSTRLDPAAAAQAVIDGARSLHDRIAGGAAMKLPNLLALENLIQQALVLTDTAAWRSSEVRDPPRASGLMAWQVATVKALMMERLDTPLSTLELAESAKLSVSHFARAFRTSCGLSPMKYLTRLRLERAETLLRETDAPLSLIALECGFSDQSHFSRVFGAAMGVSPGRWRRSHALAPNASRRQPVALLN